MSSYVGPNLASPFWIPAPFRSAPQVVTPLGAPVPVGSVLGCGTVGIVYSETITVQGGTPSYTFSVISGSLPTSLSLGTSTGIISGTPSAAGTFSFTINVVDINGNNGPQAFQITISNPSSGGSNFCIIY